MSYSYHRLGETAGPRSAAALHTVIGLAAVIGLGALLFTSQRPTRRNARRTSIQKRPRRRTQRNAKRRTSTAANATTSGRRTTSPSAVTVYADSVATRGTKEWDHVFIKALHEGVPKTERTSGTRRTSSKAHPKTKRRTSRPKSKARQLRLMHGKKVVDTTPLSRAAYADLKREVMARVREESNSSRGHEWSIWLNDERQLYECWWVDKPPMVGCLEMPAKEEKRLLGNPRRQAPRRTSARRRKRGRPAGGVAHEIGMTVTIDRQPYEVDVVRGAVMYGGRRMGSVYDLGTSFQAVPRRGDARGFGTLAGAVKHVLRQTEAA